MTMGMTNPAVFILCIGDEQNTVQTQTERITKWHELLMVLK